MKRATKLFIVFFTLMFFVSSAFASGFTQNSDQIEEAARSVLKLYVYDSPYADVEDYYATGSGFVALNSSTLITNYHVIDGAEWVLALDDYDKAYELKYVLCADEDFDIAILEFEESTSLKPLELYPDNDLKRGSPVVAIGSPKGLKNTVSSGIVSSVFEEDGIPFIQTTAPISPGSSGGALFNDDGKVIGVTSSGYKTKDEYGEDTAAQNINFAINSAVPQAMYNAWDGTKYSFTNYKKSAKMDFTGVYNHQSDTGNQEAIVTAIPVDNTVSASETWTCPNCGTVNSDRFCYECGTEKPSWICVCGRQNSGKFCGSCGRKAEDLVLEFNQAIELIDAHEFDKAASALEAMGQYNSGSFPTVKGAHVEAKAYISEVYYQQGMYLVSIHGDHDSILDCFTKAGNYEDTADQIKAENDRYYGAFYNDGIEQVKNGDYLAAMASFTKAGDYSDAKEKIKYTYYLYGESLLNEKLYNDSRIFFGKAGNYGDAKTMILKAYYEEGSDWYARGEYNNAIDSFTNAKGYPGAKNSILKCYYALGKDAMQNGQTADAVTFLALAGEYEDAKDLIEQIKENEKATAYDTAMASFNDENYEQAKQEFRKLSGYRDADEYAVLSEIKQIRKKYDGYLLKNYKGISFYTPLAKSLENYLENNEAKELWKEIQYRIGVLHREEGDFEESIKGFEKADDYSDATSQIKKTAELYFERLLKTKNYEAASTLLHEKLIPLGYDADYLIMQPGDSGDIPTYVLSLIRIMELSWNIPKNEETYKEAYIPSVQQLEEHFGLNPDGNISLDEYIALKDLIYKGFQNNKVKSLVEKLYDLSYLRSLAEDHTVYVNGYYSGIKDAEKALELTIDGVITPEEYEVILKQKVEIDKPGKLNMQASNDTVTLTWTGVKGAIKYKVFKGKILLGVTTQCRWVDKAVKTGQTISYKVEAIKYTVSSSSVVSKYVDPYYKPISAKDLNSNKFSMKGSYVSMSGLQIYSWSVDCGKEGFQNTELAKFKAQTLDKYDVYLLCRSGSSYVEIILENYKSWDWQNRTQDLLGMINRITGITVKGEVQNIFGSWGSVSSIPSIIINNISWNYR